MNDSVIKLSLFVVGLLCSVIGTLSMVILLNIQTQIKEVRYTVDGICDTQSKYWPDHACKRK